MKRIDSIDVVRGLVMVIMALDHTRELIHVNALAQNPLDFATTTPALFMTRWITHLCAPIFVFLSGTSAFLSVQKTGDVAQSRRFLLTRGVWLIVLEFTVVGFGLWFDITFSVFLFQVIAAIGVGFIVLGLLLPLKKQWIGIFGVLIVAFHHLVPLIPLAKTSPLRAVIQFCFSMGMIPIGDAKLVIGYPPVPWLGILLVGFWAGSLFLREQRERTRWCIGIGVGSLAAFAILRAGNFYGDPSPWGVQQSAVFNMLSFVNVTKYPPSLLFDLLMLGIMFLLLAWAERTSNSKASQVMAVYGRVPLFYYLVHWYVIHATMFLVLFSQGFTAGDFQFGFNFGRPQAESGLNLAGVYAIWIGVVVLLYPACRWYGQYKLAHPEQRWLRYL